MQGTGRAGWLYLAFLGLIGAAIAIPGALLYPSAWDQPVYVAPLSLVTTAFR